jgi:hypothetical protein
MNASVSDKKLKDPIRGDDTASAATEGVDDDLVEVGTVSETKGGVLGVQPDVGNGLRGPG